MATLAQLVVKVAADVSEFTRDIEKAQKQWRRTARDLSDTGRTLTTAVSLPLALVSGAAIKMAMDAVESENLFTVSMGKMADSARAWSQDLSKSLGLNEFELRKQVATLFTMTNSMGVGEQAAYQMSTGLVQLAYDLASFRNLRPEEAFQKLRAGIVGETEPLKALGIVVDETATKTWAYTHGLVAQGQELTQQQKVLARYGVIMERTAKDQGDLARTIDSPTNQLRIMREQVSQLSIKFGMALLPVVQQLIAQASPLVERLAQAVQWFTSLDQGTQSWIIGLTALVVVVGPLLMLIGGMVSGFSAVVSAMRILTPITIATTKAQTGLNVAMRANPIGLVITVIAALVAGIIALRNWMERTGTTWVDVWSRIKASAAEAVASVLRGLEKLAGWIPIVGNSLRGLSDEFSAYAAKEREGIEQRARLATHAKIAAEANKLFADTIQAAHSPTMDFTNAISGATAAQAGLQQQIEKTTAALDDQYKVQLEGIPKAVDLSTAAGRAVYKAVTGSYIPGMGGEKPTVLQTADYQAEVIKRLGAAAGAKHLAQYATPFATGGMVPGPTGAPMLAMVHGGERVLTPAQQRGGQVVNVNIYGDTYGVLDFERKVKQTVRDAIQGGAYRGVLATP